MIRELESESTYCGMDVSLNGGRYTTPELHSHKTYLLLHVNLAGGVRKGNSERATRNERVKKRNQAST